MAAQFENACQQLCVPLRDLPPRSPKFDGCVERAGRSVRIELWDLCDGPLTIEQVAQRLASYEFFYNYQRHHASLPYQTPNECIVGLEAA